MIPMICPNCNRPIEMPEHLAGVETTCPKCMQNLVVGNPSAELMLSRLVADVSAIRHTLATMMFLMVVAAAAWVAFLWVTP
jgi:hypothetical protein